MQMLEDLVALVCETYLPDVRLGDKLTDTRDIFLRGSGAIVQLQVLSPSIPYHSGYILGVKRVFL
jgi:hypothetical protein